MTRIRLSILQALKQLALQPHRYSAFVLTVVLTTAAVILAGARAHAQQFTALYTFEDPTKGAQPEGGLVRDGAGNLYGTTYRGGALGSGAVFKLDTSNNLTDIYSFTGSSDGAEPVDTLFRSSTGSLYGVASAGGVTSTGCASIDGTPGCGTIFKVTLGGHLHVLHAFHGPDGANPFARLFRDAAGNFYGTTYFGGASNHGTVYKLDRAGTFSVLHSFTGGADGRNPRGRVILDSQGNLYGTTSLGGTGCQLGSGCGVVFKLTPTGTLTVLHSFADSPDGSSPSAGLQWDKSGNMWGTTTGGGNANCDLNGTPCGTVFKIRTNGAETVFYTFDGSDGAPGGGVILDSAGNLYGVTHGDDRANFGAVYKLSPTALKNDLYFFKNGNDGSDPVGTLILDNAGNLYGTAQGNGPPYGTIFKITP